MNLKLGKIITKIRDAETVFGDLVGGAAELNAAMQTPITEKMAFVIPLIESCNKSKSVNYVDNILTERFGVVVVVFNDESQAEKLGVTAYDQLHDMREELFECLLGWEISEGYGMVQYVGGKLITLNGAYLWYQFEFEYLARIGKIGEADGLVIYGLQERTVTEGVPVPFDRIYTQMLQHTDLRLPITDIPYSDGYPNVHIPDMAQMIDLTVSPLAGPFLGTAFATGFDLDRDD